MSCTLTFAVALQIYPIQTNKNNNCVKGLLGHRVAKYHLLSHYYSLSSALGMRIKNCSVLYYK